MARLEEILKTLSLEDLSSLSRIKSKGMINGKRDVDLNDPLTYTDTEIEDVPLPDDLKYVTRGEGLRKKEYVGNKGRDELNFLQKIGLGIVDAFTDNKFDWDRADLVPRDEYNAKRLAERRRKAVLSGKPTMTREDALESLEGRRALDSYEIAKAQYQRDEQLKYILAAYPQLTGMISDQILENRRRAEQLNSEISKNLNEAYRRRNATNLTNAQAYALIANAMKTGLERKV